MLLVGRPVGLQLQAIWPGRTNGQGMRRSSRAEKTQRQKTCCAVAPDIMATR